MQRKTSYFGRRIAKRTEETTGAPYKNYFQDRNPLVEPYILGVSAGVAFGAGLAILFPKFPFSLQVLAFIFGVFAVLGADTLSRVGRQTPLITFIGVRLRLEYSINN